MNDSERASTNGATIVFYASAPKKRANSTISARNRQQSNLIILPKETETLDIHNRILAIHHRSLPLSGDSDSYRYFLILGIQTDDGQDSDEHAGETRVGEKEDDYKTSLKSWDLFRFITVQFFSSMMRN